MLRCVQQQQATIYHTYTDNVYTFPFIYILNSECCCAVLMRFIYLEHHIIAIIRHCIKCALHV